MSECSLRKADTGGGSKNAKASLAVSAIRCEASQITRLQPSLSQIEVCVHPPIKVCAQAEHIATWHVFASVLSISIWQTHGHWNAPHVYSTLAVNERYDPPNKSYRSRRAVKCKHTQEAVPKMWHCDWLLGRFSVNRHIQQLAYAFTHPHWKLVSVRFSADGSACSSFASAVCIIP